MVANSLDGKQKLFNVQSANFVPIQVAYLTAHA